MSPSSCISSFPLEINHSLSLSDPLVKGENFIPSLKFDNKGYIHHFANIQKREGILLASVIIAEQPYKQNHSWIYPLSDSRSIRSLSSDLPFSKWTEENKLQAVQNLKNLKIPLKKETLRQIYQIFKANTDKLFYLQGVNYPLIFKAEACYRGEDHPKISTPKFIPFQIEVYSETEAYLLFPKHEKTHIAKGGFKKVKIIYPLGKSSDIIVRTHSFKKKIEEAESVKRIFQNEDQFLSLHNGQFHIISIFDIIYYEKLNNKNPVPQQTVKMEYFPQDLCDAVISTEFYQSFSDQDIIDCSLHLAETIEYLHANKTVYGDFKLENILIDLKTKKIKLTDFGFSYLMDDSTLNCLSRGSAGYIAPELACNDNNIKKTGAIDIWGLACIFWLMWCKDEDFKYSWYTNEMNLYNKLDILKLMRSYDLKVPSADLKLIFLLWNMLRFDPKERYSIQQVIKYLKDLKGNLFKQPGFSLSHQFISELERNKAIYLHKYNKIVQ